MNRRLILSTLVMMLVLFMPLSVQAKDVKRYTTQSVVLKNKVKGKKVYKVPKNTKVILIKSGRTWAKVRYKKQELVCRKKYLLDERSPKKYTGAYFRKAGAIWWHSKKYTWYSQRVLPDPSNWLGIKGKHVDEQGFICDKWDYIALGSNVGNRGKIVATPFGKFGKVYDAGYVGSYWYDCYTDW